ncbi:outer membrane-specific lipoprotein transporter subunit; ATP-binding component of ABC superfamily [Alteromonas sp. 38]|uniref:lipoprotein-releasing ABC transporter ATP-binding protein LolD n=1 Tax=Alteromonas TaxID=226 RepID=UPI0012EF9D8B|nr:MULTISPECIES: lipoprotein-releasing ABC transporter ATP-binding protein LolD [Alteromonas]CAD5279701.1 outer membrane-specific lipoprotein transporter subunit; ATP-binding component of ABC superfamily [Alteromonas sp. 154]VXB77559.1 outer membrane-specific lipoprotein transporter subunit; ATP-binding component of ABC superfamily [Alteromonas sp. 38]
MQDVLHCRKICKTYQEGENSTPVLNNISLSINAGEHVAILGSSGSGKSTLLHLLGGLDTPTSGEVWFKGESLTHLNAKQLAALRNKEMGFIYQFHHLLGEFTALENVAMPLRIGGESATSANEKANALLNDVGLSHRADHLPSALSGGERQRVAIARALVTSPSVVLADEPTGNLDATTGEQIYQLLKRLSEQKQTAFVVVTHDITLANRMDRVLRIKDGELLNTATEEQP